jgi:hypothetical protein
MKDLMPLFVDCIVKNENKVKAICEVASISKRFRVCRVLIKDSQKVSA